MLEGQGLSAFKGFQLPQVKKNSKILPIYIYFQSVAKNIKR
jgi:hypothetical protein